MVKTSLTDSQAYFHQLMGGTRLGSIKKAREYLGSKDFGPGASGYPDKLPDGTAQAVPSPSHFAVYLFGFHKTQTQRSVKTVN